MSMFLRCSGCSDRVPAQRPPERKDRFTMDKTLEHAWDEMTENFFKKKGIDFELLN